MAFRSRRFTAVRVARKLAADSVGCRDFSLSICGVNGHPCRPNSDPCSVKRCSGLKSEGTVPNDGK
jgi:hypothetical protein